MTGDAGLVGIGECMVELSEAEGGLLRRAFAGDSFNGAFLAEYVRTGDIPASVRAGQTCAAEVICHRGALVGRPGS